MQISLQLLANNIFKVKIASLYWLISHKYPSREIVSVLKKQRLIISENRLNQRYQFYEEKGG